jgi:hypothetical protein
VTGALVVDVHGSSGDDSIDIGLRPRVVDSDSEYALRVFGEDGDDQIDVRIDADPDGRGRIVAELFGGAGDDELGLAVFGVDDPLFDGLVDGGAGFDVARGTRNVLFRNVEEVFLIE